MRYIPIARRYRPGTFSEIVGQESIVKTLQNQLKTGRVPHAFLFSGTRGVGKTTTARILAKALNCEKGITPEPCNECSACRAIDEGTSLALMEIDGASNRGIDEVRSLQEAIAQKPLEGRMKVVIIDEVHMLTQEAFNALLKTIEEPPEHVVFVLATTDYQRIPATILSRTVHFHFREIPEEIIRNQIIKISKKEGLEIEPEAAQLISEAAEGSMRDAETALEKVIAYSDEKIKVEDVEKALGLVPRALMEQLTVALEKKDRKRIFDIVEEIFLQGYNVRRFLKDYLGFLRNLLNERAKGKTTRFRSLSREDILRYSNLLLEGEYRVKNATNPRVYLELLLIKMSFLSNVVDLEKIIEGLIKGENIPLVSSTPSTVVATEEEKAREDHERKVKEKAQNKKNHGSEVAEFIKELDKKSSVLSTAVEEASSIKVEGNKIFLRYRGDEGEYYKEVIEKHMDEIRVIAERVFSSSSMEIIPILKGKEKEEVIEKNEDNGGENPKIMLFRKIFKATEIKEE